jgi:hypothetical protein
VQYHSNVFSPETWGEFVAAGSDQSGFARSRAGYARTVEVGDRLLCWLKGRASWIGALEVTGPPFESTEPSWQTARFPIRVPVRPLVILDIENPLPMVQLEGKLSFYSLGMKPIQYSYHLQGSPHSMRLDDGEVVYRALRAYEDGGQAARADLPEDVPSSSSEMVIKETQHTATQLTLVKWGLSIGCQVWVPRSDRRRVTALSEGEARVTLLEKLPPVFGGRAQAIVENIDVLWLKGQSVVAGFEIEHSTSIYSGLLRLSDLIASVPNIKIDLFIVAAEERASEVQRQLTRPTFAALEPPLSATCGFISYERLSHQYAQLGPMLKHMKPEGIKELAEFFDQP